jgi:hypothetical protein
MKSPTLMTIRQLQETMAFIHIIWTASLEDPIAKMMPTMLTRLCNPPTTPLQIQSPGIHHSISTYLALKHLSQNAYERVIKSTCTNFLDAPGVAQCLRFAMVEDLIAGYTSIEPIEHDMCTNLTFTSPFAALNRCPICNSSRWNQARLDAINGHLKILAKTF